MTVVREGQAVGGESEWGVVLPVHCVEENYFFPPSNPLSASVA
jgi:hypothetical protein